MKGFFVFSLLAFFVPFTRPKYLWPHNASRSIKLPVASDSQEFRGKKTKNNNKKGRRRDLLLFWPVENDETVYRPAMCNAFSRLFLSFLYASLRSSLRVLSSLFSVRPTRKNLISNELASAIDDRRCFCSRGGRHFDTPVAQQRSHTRKPFEFFFSVSDKFPKEILRDVEEEKKGEKDKTSRIVNCRTHDRWGPESRNLQSRSSGKKEAWVSFVVAKTHTLLAIKLISPTARSPKLFYRFLPRQTPRTR